jgi:hypothetical protein
VSLRLVIAIACAWLAFSPFARAADLLEIYAMARESDPELRAVALAHEASFEVYKQARGGYLPSINFSYDRTQTEQRIHDSDNVLFQTGRSDFPTDALLLSLTQPVFRYANFVRIEQAKAEIDQADAALAQAEQALILRVVEAYLGVLAARDRLDFLAAEQVSVEKQLALAEGREKAEVELHRAELEFGRVTSTRNAELFAQKLISAQELDEVEIKTRVAGLQLAAAEARTRQRVITSPIDGVVLARLMDPGEYVGEEAVLRLADLDPLHVEAVLPRELFGTLAADGNAEITLGEPLGGTRTARIAVIDPVIDAASGTFGVRLVLPNPDHAVPAGLKCEVRFVTTADTP